MLMRLPQSTFRILHILRAPVGGLFRHVRDLAAAQTARGHEVGIVCDAIVADRLTQGRLAALAPHAKLGVHRIAMSREVGWRDVTAFRAARALVARLEIGICHGHGAKGGAYARLVARSVSADGRNVRAIYTPHGGSLHYHPASLIGRAYMEIERRLARMSDAIIFESAYSRDVFAANVGAGLAPCVVVHNGLAPDDFIEHRPAADAADFLFVGELRRLKGVDVLLAAIALVRRDRAVCAVIVGDGPDAAEFNAQAQTLGLADATRFPGAMPLSQALPLGRAMVVPSRAESFPYIVLESAAAGIPLLATDVGGIGEIVAGTTTRLLPADDPAALAAAMIAILDDQASARDRARALRERAAQAFTIDAMTDGVLDVYQRSAASLTVR